LRTQELPAIKTIMHRFFLMFVFIGFLASPSSSHAQEPVQEPFEIGESGEEYLRSLPWRGIETDVVYFDPSGPPPELDTKQRLESTPSGGTGQDQDLNARLTTGLIAGAILVLIAYLFLRFGGGIAVSLKRDAVNPGSRRAAKRDSAPPWAEKLSIFDEILRTSDRRRAPDATQLDRARGSSAPSAGTAQARRAPLTGFDKRTGAVRRARCHGRRIPGPFCK
jgi:hypothetical protein